MSKLIRVPDEVYDALTEIRWVERKPSFGEVIHQLIEACYPGEDDEEGYQADFDDFDEE